MGSSSWWLAWAMYAPVAAAGLAWAKWARGAAFVAPAAGFVSNDPARALGVGIALALALSGITIWSSRLLATHTRWGRELLETLRLPLVGASRGRLLMLAMLSAFSEELFFRAALQPTVGIGLASVAFGLVHVSPRGQGFAWSLWAGLMGVLFGLLFEASGHLAVPMLAHALINYENMLYICRFEPTHSDTLRPRAHTTLGRSRQR